MSETWTPATSSSETWTSEAPGLHVFSSLVFSNATYNSLHVFALGNAGAGVEGWYKKTSSAETWASA